MIFDTFSGKKVLDALVRFLQLRHATPADPAGINWCKTQGVGMLLTRKLDASRFGGGGRKSLKRLAYIDEELKHIGEEELHGLCRACRRCHWSS